MATYRYLVIVEKGDKGNYGVYAPDLPGCVSVGDTPQEALKNMHGALAMHIKSMLQDGDSIPEAVSTADYVEVTL
jgi:predicted RNase H-like HicB family nuclease